jgi:hypothetical protein
VEEVAYKPKIRVKRAAVSDNVMAGWAEYFRKTAMQFILILTWQPHIFKYQKTINFFTSKLAQKFYIFDTCIL